jgi:heptose-I-phosphate ethanolaminephosphotransferase
VDIGPKDKCLWTVTCIVLGLALCTIDLFFRKRSEKIFLGFLFLLSLFPNVVIWSYLYISNIYLIRDMYWVLFNSNTNESIEYIHQFISWEIFLFICFYIGTGVFFFIKARSSHTLRASGNPLAALALAILIVLSSIYFQYLSQAIPTFELYKSYFLFHEEYRVFDREKKLRQELTMDVQCHLPDSTGHVFVILLGESTTTCHMSLYGYFRPTTPLMDALRDELDVYTDVVAPDTHTYGVMQKALTFANHKHPEYYKKKASIVELFNVAGFETYWIANSAFMSKWGASYGVIAQQAQHIYDVSVAHKPDEIVIPPLKKIMTDGRTRNKVIFIHLMGNHHAYDARYPGSFARFDHRNKEDLADKGFRNYRMKKTIDEYDNSILYGDYIYNTILEELKEANRSSWLLFFSDHGEEVFDTRAVSGHLMSNVYPCQCRIPFVLWRSEKYKAENPDLVIDTARSYSTEDVIYSVSTLSRLEYEGYDRSLSIFTPEYAAPSSRMVGTEDYEDILKKPGNK